MLEMCRLALEPWSLKNWSSRLWLSSQNIHLRLARLLARWIESPSALHDFLLTVFGLIIVYSEDSPCFLLVESVAHVSTPEWVKANIVFFNSCFHFHFYVFFVPLHKFLPYLFPVG